MRSCVDPALTATQELAVREVGPGLVVGASAGLGVVSQGAVEQRRGCGGVGEQGAAVVEGGQRPRPPGAVGEAGQLLDPRRGLLPVTGPDSGVDAIEGGEPAQ
jgi:hypothetical protein